MEKAWFFAYALVVYIPVILILGIYTYIHEKAETNKPIHYVQIPVKKVPETKTVQDRVSTQAESAVYSYSEDYPIFNDHFKNHSHQENYSGEMKR